MAFESDLIAENLRKNKKSRLLRGGVFGFQLWLRGLDLNQRPSGYEHDDKPTMI